MVAHAFGKGNKMSGLLKEILDMVALPFEWSSNERATFEFNGETFGIFVEFARLELQSSNREYNVSNISFGIIDKNRIKTFSPNDLNTEITNFGKPRTILSTVAEACLANKELISSDVIALAAADQAKEGRALVYSLAISEIRNKHTGFFKSNDIRLKNSEGKYFVLLSKVNFSDEEKQEVADKLGFSK